MVAIPSYTDRLARQAKGATRRWANPDEFVREVSDARIWGGIHFRAATDTGEAMGRQIGELAARQLGATR